LALCITKTPSSKPGELGELTLTGGEGPGEKKQQRQSSYQIKEEELPLIDEVEETRTRSIVTGYTAGWCETKGVFVGASDLRAFEVEGRASLMMASGTVEGSALRGMAEKPDVGCDRTKLLVGGCGAIY
jgi:hypothetical protein